MIAPDAWTAGMVCDNEFWPYQDMIQIDAQPGVGREGHPGWLQTETFAAVFQTGFFHEAAKGRRIQGGVEVSQNDNLATRLNFLGDPFESLIAKVKVLRASGRHEVEDHQVNGASFHTHRRRHIGNGMIMKGDMAGIFNRIFG